MRFTLSSSNRIEGSNICLIQYTVSMMNVWELVNLIDHMNGGIKIQNNRLLWEEQQDLLFIYARMTRGKSPWAKCNNGWVADGVAGANSWVKLWWVLWYEVMMNAYSPSNIYVYTLIIIIDWCNLIHIQSYIYIHIHNVNLHFDGDMFQPAQNNRRSLRFYPYPSLGCASGFLHSNTTLHSIRARKFDGKFPWFGTSGPVRRELSMWTEPTEPLVILSGRYIWCN